MLSKDALEKKAQQWESMRADDAEREFYWWFAGATFLKIGTWSAGYLYAEILWMIKATNITLGDRETL